MCVEPTKGEIMTDLQQLIKGQMEAKSALKNHNTHCGSDVKLILLRLNYVHFSMSIIKCFNAPYGLAYYDRKPTIAGIV